MHHLSNLPTPHGMRPAAMPALARQHVPALEVPRAASTAPLTGDRDATGAQGQRSGMSLPAFKPTPETFDGVLDRDALLAMVKDPALLRWLLERLDAAPASQPGEARAA